MRIPETAVYFAGIGGSACREVERLLHAVAQNAAGQEAGDEAVARAHGVDRLHGLDALVIAHALFREQRAARAQCNAHHRRAQAVADHICH